ncbi:MAG: TlpA family protein disulfide reductase [Candidatus Cyclobacteriaceae bacterium M3_2C_046]
MKYLLFLTLFLALLQCQPESPDQTIVSGKIKGLEQDSLNISYFKHHYLEGPEKIWVQLDSAGSFSTALPVDGLKSFQIMLNSRQRVSFWLKPEWQLEIEMLINEQGEIDSLTFSGDGAMENDTYQHLEEMKFAAFNHIQKDAPAFNHALDSLETVMIGYLDDLKLEEQTDPELLNVLEAEIKYHKISRWLDYYTRNYVYGDKEKTDFVLDQNKAYLSGIVLSNPDLLHSNYYNSTLDDYFEQLDQTLVDYDSIMQEYKENRSELIKTYYQVKVNSILDLIDSLVMDPAIKSRAYYSFFLRNANLNSLTPFKQNYENRFLSAVTDTDQQDFMNEKLAQLETLMPGKPAPQFTFSDIEGNLVSLEDLKGQYVYIDVWATWCGPCIAEIPQLKALEEDFGQQIAFVSISIDPSEEKWKNYVGEKELGGIQLYSEGAWDSEINELFMIRGIPRFILIDPEGNIVNADASRPSSPDTRKLFEKWVAEMET